MYNIVYVFLSVIQTILCSGDHASILFHLRTESGCTTCEVQKNVTIVENQIVDLNITSENPVTQLRCDVRDRKYHSNFESKTHVTKKFNDTSSYYIFTIDAEKKIIGEWKCKLNIKNIHPIPENSNCMLNSKNETTTTCRLHVHVADRSFCQNNVCVYIGIGVLLLLTIITGQTACVIYFRRKAQSLHRLENLSARPRDKNDKARYSENPKKKPLIPLETTGSDSVIYEALDSGLLEGRPEPPALETLPRSKKPSEASKDTASSSKADSKKEEITEKEAPKEKTKGETVAGVKKFSLPGLAVAKTQVEEKQRSFSAGKPTVKPKPPENKRNTIDRIKERPPLPLPDPQTPEEPGEYEVMSSSPPRSPQPVKSKFQKPAKQPAKPTPKKTLPNPKPQNNPLKPIPPPTQNKPKKLVVPPKSDTVTELENLLKKNKRLNSTSPHPTLKKPSAKPQIPLLPKPTPAAVKSSLPSPMDAPVPPPISTLPRPKMASPVVEEPAPAFKPVKQPTMNAPEPPPISTLPRPKMTSPVVEAPKPPPISTLPKAAIPIPQEPDEEIYNSDEEWTYEPLEKYNIYSM